MNKKDLATFDMLTAPEKPSSADRYRSKSRLSNRQEDIETQLRRLEYRLIILSLMQGQGRSYLNRMERMQYEDICQHLNNEFANKLTQKQGASKARKGVTEMKPKVRKAPADLSEAKELIRYWMIRFRGAIQELNKEPCDHCAQMELQETGKNLIPLIRNHLTEAPV